MPMAGHAPMRKTRTVWTPAVKFDQPFRKASASQAPKLLPVEVISATQRDVERYALPCVMSTADISEGSSGGALLNVYGQAVAVTSGAYVYGNSMYLAVPIDPILTADLTGEGLTLPEVLEAETVG